MKKYLFLLLAIIIVVLLYIEFKSIYLTDQSNNENLLNAVKTENVNLTISTDKTDYNWTNTRIQLLIENHGSTNVEFGEIYTIEKLQNGEWYKVPFKSMIAFKDGLYNLSPNNTYKQKIDLSYFDYNFKVGKFRVVKEFISDGYKISLASEFNINIF